MLKFSKYLKKQWLDSQFSNWQIFLTPAGYAPTTRQSNRITIQSKKHFTDRIKYHMKTALDIFQNCISYESKTLKFIENQGKATVFIKNLAKKIVNEQKLMISGGRYLYSQANGNIVTIDVALKTCTFVDKCVCKHLISICIIEKIPYNGLPNRNRLVSLKRKRKQVDES